MKRLHLLCPGVATDDMAGAQTTVPAGLRTLLARADAAGDGGGGLSGRLARLFGVPGSALAALCLAAEGGDPGGDMWFRADPVHLSAGLHHVTLRDDFPLAAAEAAALVDSLNGLFAGEPAFLAPHPQRWYARFQRPLRVATAPLDRVRGGILTPDLIAGPDAGTLRRLATETQMLLHDHPLNQAREARGLPAVNGVWFWGGGTAGEVRADFRLLLGDDFTAGALARAAGIPRHPLPARFDPHDLPDGTTLAVLEAHGPPSGRLETDAREWDAAWYRPVLRALQRGRLDAVILDVETGLYRAGRLAAWRLWRTAST